MAEFPLLKDMIDKRLVGQIADRISLVHDPFDRKGFVQAVAVKLEDLELKQRFAWVADQLRVYLPDDYPTALGILLRILDETEDRFEPIEDAGFRLLPIPTFVYRHGLGHLEASLDAMYMSLRGIHHVKRQFGPISSNIRRRRWRGCINGRWMKTNMCAAWSAKAAGRACPGGRS